MKYIVRNIHQMRPDEVRQYVNLFNRIFDKHLTVDEFFYKCSRQFGNNSYFSLMVDEARGIVGSVGAIEVAYMWRGQRMIFGLTVDGMIDPEFRGDFLTLKRLHDALVAELLQKGVIFIFTKPNDNSYLYLKKILDLRDLATLQVYAFPLQFFHTISRKLSWLDKFWLFAIDRIPLGRKSFRDVSVQQIAKMARPWEAEVASEAYRPRNAEFYERRYGTNAYQGAALDEKFVIYRIQQFDHICACFIMEASPLATIEWMAFARYLVRRHADVAVMLQVDSGQGQNRPFFRVPLRFLPDKLNIVGKILNPSMRTEDITFKMRLADFEVV